MDEDLHVSDDFLLIKKCDFLSFLAQRFDLMCDMAFGGGFETMRDGTENVGIWHAIEGGVK